MGISIFGGSLIPNSFFGSVSDLLFCFYFFDLLCFVFILEGVSMMVQAPLHCSFCLKRMIVLRKKSIYRQRCIIL